MATLAELLATAKAKAAEASISEEAKPALPGGGNVITSQPQTPPPAITALAIKQSGAIQPSACANICQRLEQLQSDLLAANPGISENLRLIHRALLDDPEQVTLLTDDQRAVFFQGLMRQTTTVITATASKTRGSKKEYASLTVDDLL